MPTSASVSEVCGTQLTPRSAAHSVGPPPRKIQTACLTAQETTFPFGFPTLQRSQAFWCRTLVPGPPEARLDVPTHVFMDLLRPFLMSLHTPPWTYPATPGCSKNQHVPCAFQCFCVWRPSCESLAIGASDSEFGRNSSLVGAASDLHNASLMPEPLGSPQWRPHARFLGPGGDTSRGCLRSIIPWRSESACMAS